jgi:hypothetical protein
MSNWIKCSEQMPPHEGRYLVYVPYMKWTGVSSMRQGKFDDRTASHWQELPSKPEGEE